LPPGGSRRGHRAGGPLIVSFIRDIYAKLGWLAGALFALTGLTAVLEGLAVALLLPLLREIGLGGEGAGSDPVTALVAGLAARAGLPMTLPVLAVAIVAAVALQVAIFLAAQYVSGRCQAAYISAWLEAQFDGLVAAKWALFRHRTMAQAVNNLTGDILNKMANAFIHLMVFTGAAFFIAVYTALAFVISWRLTLFLAVAALVLIVVMRPLAKYADRVGRDLIEADGSMTALITQYVAGIKVMKVFGLEGAARRDFAAEARSRERSYFHYIFDPGFSRAVVELFAPVILISALVLGTGALAPDLAAVLVVLALFARLYPRLSTLQQALHSLNILLPAFSSTLELARETAAMREHTRPVPGEALTGPIGLELVEVAIGYGGEPVIEDASAEIPPGAFAVVTGPSGAGKTTLIDAVLGLTELDGGDIIARGRSLREIPTETWRKAIGYVDQDSLLFHDTIANNIRAGDESLDSAAVEEAARLACADEFIAAMEGGYERVVGEGGKGISGGQRQRIALARALARGPGLLLLDEATSALDQETEARILGTLKALRGKTTVLLMTHRDQPRKAADLVFELREGRLKRARGRAPA